jgi:hypothetical protein
MGSGRREIAADEMMILLADCEEAPFTSKKSLGSWGKGLQEYNVPAFSTMLHLVFQSAKCFRKALRTAALFGRSPVTAITGVRVT